MDSKPLAIIIPAYKQTYFRETLQSISLQSCTNFTLYIGDDCSPYDLRSIVYEFESKIDIVYHRFEENLGSKDLVAHWDRCIALSQGEPYIWLFSDDDMMESRCVEEFLKLPKETRDNHLVHFDTYIMDEATGSSTTTRPFPALITPMDFLEEKLRINKKQGLEIFVVEFIFSREVYENEHKFQTYDLAWGSDFITWLKFSSSKKGIFTIKATECHIIWRKSLENITPNQSHPITLRKLSSLVYNAAYINTWLKENHHYPFFKYSKFVWGNIKESAPILSLREIYNLWKLYNKEVGHYCLSTVSFIIVVTLKSTSIIKEWLQRKSI